MLDEKIKKRKNKKPISSQKILKKRKKKINLSQIPQHEGYNFISEE